MDEIDGHELTVRKKLSFESEEDNDSSSKSWYQYSSDSDWLQSGAIELDEASELEESLLAPPSGPADVPEESEHKGTSTCEETNGFIAISKFDNFSTCSRRYWPCIQQGEGAQTGDGGRTDGFFVWRGMSKQEPQAGSALQQPRSGPQQRV